MILAGQYNKWVSRQRLSFGPGVDAWSVSLQYLMGAVLVSGGIIIGCYKHIQDNVIPTLEASKEAATTAVSSVTKRKPMTMRESFDFLMKSPYIRNLAVLVISYGLAINVVEVSWKAKLKQAFPDPNSYSSFMGNFSSATGVVTLVMMLVGRTIFQRFGWRTAAMITPTVRPTWLFDAADVCASSDKYPCVVCFLLRYLVSRVSVSSVLAFSAMLLHP